MEIKKKNSFAIWVKITNYESAQEAIRQTYIIGFTLAFTYALFAISVISALLISAKVPMSQIWQTSFIAVPIIAFPLWSGFRIKKGNFGLVPLIIVWGFGQTILIIIDRLLFQFPSQGSFATIEVIISYIAAAILIVKGWNALQAYSQMRKGIVKKDE